MSRWQALIVDDEALARDNLQLALAGHPNWLCVDTCADAAQARAALAQHAVDLLLLDIRLPRQSGLSLAAELSRQPTPPAIVFVTADDAHALRAFDVYALDYLLKPFDNQRFAAMLARVERALVQPGPAGVPATAPTRHIQVRSMRSVAKVAVANICLVRAAGNYVELHQHGGMVLHRSSMEAMEKLLPPGQFIRVHRTALVRASAIQSLTATGEKTFIAQLSIGMLVPVSERFVGQVRQLFA